LLGVASLVYGSSFIETEEPELEAVSSTCIEPAQVEFPAPEIELTNLSGNEVHVDDYSGDVVMLNTWATWCPPCLAEMPDLQAFFETYKDHAFTLIGINIGETREQVLNFGIEQDLSFPLWLDPKEESLRALNTILLPYSVVIDRNGVVRFAWSGATCVEALERVVAPLILQ
jgi:peroxiredoxin